MYFCEIEDIQMIQYDEVDMSIDNDLIKFNKLVSTSFLVCDCQTKHEKVNIFSLFNHKLFPISTKFVT